MSDIITVRGFVATEVRSSTTPGGTQTASFRLGSTERRFDRSTSTWIDGNTNWFTVQSFRQLAGHIGCSLKKGQRVIVVGKLKLRQWERDGKIYHVAEIDAESIGHDLMWGSANFIRMTSNSGQQASSSETPSAESPSAEVPESNPWTTSEDPDGPPDEEGGPSGNSLEVLDDDDGESVLVDTQTGELLPAEA